MAKKVWSGCGLWLALGCFVTSGPGPAPRPAGGGALPTQGGGGPVLQPAGGGAVTQVQGTPTGGGTTAPAGGGGTVTVEGTPVTTAPTRAPGIQAGSFVVRLGAVPAEVAETATCGNAAAEVCFNAIDDNCDGRIDEGCGVQHSAGTDLHTTTIEGGEMQFAVAWDANTDINMTVIEPNQGELPPTEGRTTDDGGEYQLEVNSACTGPINPAEENVRWTRRPPLGDWIIRVQSSSMCDAPRANATLSISVGGKVVAAYKFTLDERDETREFAFNLDTQ